ncbi:hypothetical protein TNCV_1745171 [Trichonephila clavipes]|nr:hypothetical protein TNCV_1745171 [Trichonephila clavipes]
MTKNEKRFYNDRYADQTRQGGMENHEYKQQKYLPFAVPHYYVYEKSGFCEENSTFIRNVGSHRHASGI